MSDELAVSRSITLEAVQLATQVTWPSVASSGWLMHAPFAAWLTWALEPRTFVELGTHYGFSYFTVCESARCLGQQLNAFAVDHWRGDDHAGRYSEDVYQSVCDANEPYADWSELLRMDFDEAAGHFEVGSVDLLHIDGFHTYEAVAHDFTTWQRTLSDRSVVLFHDVREYQPGFGVHRYWDELRSQYPSFTFSFGHGLGVLAVGSDPPAPVLALCELDRTASGDKVREVFELLGSSVRHWHQARDLEARLEGLRADTLNVHAQLDAARRELELAVSDRAALDADRARLDRQLGLVSADRQRVDADRQRVEADRSGLLAEREGLLAEREGLLAEHNRAAGELSTLKGTLRYRAGFGWKGRAARLRRLGRDAAETSPTE